MKLKASLSVADEFLVLTPVLVCVRVIYFSVFFVVFACSGNCSSVFLFSLCFCFLTSIVDRALSLAGAGVHQTFSI